jgi:hypothetical protein
MLLCAEFLQWVQKRDREQSKSWAEKVLSVSKEEELTKFQKAIKSSIVERRQVEKDKEI